MVRTRRATPDGPASARPDRGGAVVNGRVRRGDVFYADLRPTIGSEQDGVRPVLVVQNDVANRLSPTVVVCALTSQIKRTYLPTHVLVPDVSRTGPSIALLEQLRTLDKRRLLRRIGHASPDVMDDVDRALAYALGLLTGADLGGPRPRASGRDGEERPR